VQVPLGIKRGKLTFCEKPDGKITGIEPTKEFVQGVVRPNVITTGCRLFVQFWILALTVTLPPIDTVAGAIPNVTKLQALVASVEITVLDSG
jgi:hypothetical protein